MQPAQLASNADALILERAERDLERGLGRLRSRIREAHGPVAGATMDALVVGAVATLRLRSRRREDTLLLLRLAREVHAGADPRHVAETHLARLLRLDGGMGSLAREQDPDLGPAKRMALDLLAARLPDLARLAAVEAPADYDDLVRRAFPDRSDVDAIVEDNARRVRGIVEHLARHPHVLRVPGSLTPRLASLAYDFTERQLAEMKKGIGEIYAPQRPSTTGFVP